MNTRDFSGEDAVFGLPETGLAIIPGYRISFIALDKRFACYPFYHSSHNFFLSAATQGWWDTKALKASWEIGIKGTYIHRSKD